MTRKPRNRPAPQAPPAPAHALDGDGRPGRRLAALALILLYALSVGIKARGSIADSPSHLPFDWKDETGYFWTESAFQYRYARMAAQGERLPSVDVRAQYPEGLDLGKGLTVLMEPVCGWLAKAAAPLGLPPHLFAVVFLAAASSLSVFAVFLLVRLAGGSLFGGVAGAAFYALSPASLMRVVGTFEYENFSLPLFFLGVALFARAAARAGAAWSCGVAAGLLLVLSMMSWHFASFLAFWFMFLASAYSLAAEPEDEALARRFRGVLAALGAASVAAGLLVPSLSARLLLASPLAASVYAFWACLAAAALRPGLPRLGLLGAYAALTCGGILLLGGLAPGDGMYGHVQGLAWSKLRFLLVKPADPALLSFDARSLWLEAFSSPSPGAAVWLFAPAALIPAAWGLLRAARPAGLSPAAFRPCGFGAPGFPGGLVLLLAACSGLLYLLVDRLSVVLVFFAAAVVGLAFDAVRRERPLLASAGLALVILLESWQVAVWDRPSPLRDRLGAVAPFREAKPALMGWSEMRDVVDWARRATGPDDAFLAAFQTSPMLLTYADRPILLHPKFEEPRMRAKVKEFLEALYGREEEVYAMARRYGATYFLYQADFILDTSQDSPRYMADRLVLPADCAALAFHFFPERLERFELVHQNLFFRVFKVRDGPRTGQAAPPFRLAWYDPDLLGGRDLRGGPPRKLVREIRDRLRDEARVQEAASAAADAGDFARSRSILTAALPRALHPAWLMADLGVVASMAGDSRESLQWLARSVEADPYLPYGRKQLAMLLFNLGQSRRSYQEARLALRLNAADAELHGILGFICQSLGDHRGAVESFREALRLGSGDLQVRQALDSSLKYL
ncbi:MAG: hypothetical protein WC943_14675 [Elusimicrobiota bacterium]|jgi:tetratricopeptide (TPR) repeat protein